MRWLPLLTLLGLPAFGWPVDMQHDVQVGKEKFVKLTSVDWVEVEDRTLLTAEVMESGELLLTGLKPGRTLLLLGAGERFAVWRVRVDSPAVSGAAALASAQKACPGLTFNPDEKDQLVGAVKTAACRSALLPLLETDLLLARSLDFTFEIAVLQAQLKDIQRALDEKKSKVTARYLAASLELSGDVSPAMYRSVLWEVFRRSAGRVALENKLQLPEEPKR